MKDDGAGWTHNSARTRYARFDGDDLCVVTRVESRDWRADRIVSGRVEFVGSFRSAGEAANVLFPNEGRQRG